MSRPVGRGPATDPLRRGELSVMACGLFAVVAVMALRVRGGSTPVRVDQVAAGMVDSIGHPDVVGGIAMGAGVVIALAALAPALERAPR